MTYENAIEEIKSAVSPLGKEYVSIVEKAVKDRWIDVFPNKFKRGCMNINTKDA